MGRLLRQGTAILSDRNVNVITLQRGIKVDMASYVCTAGGRARAADDLLRGRVSRFSLDALVNIATSIGRKVRLELEAGSATARS